MYASELLEKVTDSQSFLVFARALVIDRTQAKIREAVQSSMSDIFQEDEWENTSIESFLEAAIAWAEDSDFGITQGLLPSNPWRLFAVFLYCGKIYE
ncbi:hypothetical protein [uncultured Acinetobacter sp.]|uniref:DUF7660 family protein n=1 Tax=uncultured Acinetobacter sp. TaxID=165433 RepID=UPI0026390AEC|nr:hypothetical protein [uncultured Acinetobacter sp.]